MQSDGWRLGPLAHEAIANTLPRHSRLFPLAVAGVLLGTLTSGLYVVESVAFEHALDDLAQKGRNVVIIQAADEATELQIDRASCERLSDSANVDRAGVVISEQRADVLPLGSEVSVVHVSSTLIPQVGESLAVVGSALSDRPPGTRVFVTIEGTRLDAVVGTREPTGVELNSAVALAPTPADKTAQICIVVLDRFAEIRDAVPALMAGLTIYAGTPIAVPALRESVDVVGQKKASLGRLLPVASGMFLGILVAIANVFRSSELAMYRLSGTSRVSLNLLLSLEGVFIAGLASAAFSLTSALLTLVVGLDPATSAVRALLLGATAIVTLAVASVLIVRRDPSELAKDR